jgi:O-antigen/teichoic acid export membrane protein
MESLAAKSIWSAFASVIGILGRFASNIMIARILGPIGIGQFAFLTCVCESIYVVANFGLSNGMTRYVAELQGGGRNNEIKGLMKWIYKRSVVACLSGCVLLMLFLWWYGKQTHYLSVFLIFSLVLAFIAIFFANMKTAEYTGRLDFHSLAAVNLVSAILLVVAQYFGVVFLGLTGAVVGYALGSLPLLLLVLGVLRPDRKKLDPSPMLKHEFWTYTSNAWIGHIASAVVWGRVEIFFIERYWNSYEVGLFSAGITLSSMAIYAPLLLRGAFLPHFANLLGAEDRSNIEHTYGAGTRILSLLAFPLGLGGAAIVPVLLPFLYGDQFGPAVPMAVVLLGFSCLTFGGVGSALVYGIGYSRFVAFAEGLGGIIAIAACFLIIPSHGAWGAVWVRAGVQTGIVAFQTLYIAFGLKHQVPYMFILKILFAAALCALSARAVLIFLPFPAAIPLAVGTGIGIYAICLRFLRVITNQDAEWLGRKFACAPWRIRAGLLTGLRWVAVK